MADLGAALCLVLVIEGLFLLASPDAWKRMADQLLRIEAARLRWIGAGMVLAGLILLHVVR